MSNKQCDFAKPGEPCWGIVRAIAGTQWVGVRAMAKACEGHACRWTYEHERNTRADSVSARVVDIDPIWQARS